MQVHEVSVAKLEWCDMWCGPEGMLNMSPIGRNCSREERQCLRDTSVRCGHPTMTLTLEIANDCQWLPMIANNLTSFDLTCVSSGLQWFAIISSMSLFPCLGNDFEKFDLANGIRQVRRTDSNRSTSTPHNPAPSRCHPMPDPGQTMVEKMRKEFAEYGLSFSIGLTSIW